MTAIQFASLGHSDRMNRPRVAHWLWLCLPWLVLSLTTRSFATDPDLAEGSSSSEARQMAIRQVPLQLLNDQAKQKLVPVLDDPSIFRRMPVQSVEADPEMFTFLVRHPEVMVNIWDIMGVTRVSVNRMSPFVFHGEDGAGTACQAELIYGSDDLHIYYGTGSYDGTLVGRELRGRCVCVLHSKTVQQPTGHQAVVGQMDIFLKLDNLGVDLVARSLSPFVGKTADYNFVESAKFVGQVSRVAERSPMAIQQLVARMDKVQPDVRDAFLEVSARVARRNIQILGEAPSDGINDALSGAIPGKTSPSAVAPNKSELLMRR